MFLLRLVWAVVRALLVRRADLVAENLALRQQIIAYRPFIHPTVESPDVQYFATVADTAGGGSGLGESRPAGVIEYLPEENRVLREQLGQKRLRLTDDQRRQLTAKGKTLGRKLLGEIVTLVTPDTILAWRRRLIAAKWEHSWLRIRLAPHSAGSGLSNESLDNTVFELAGMADPIP